MFLAQKKIYMAKNYSQYKIMKSYRFTQGIRKFSFFPVVANLRHFAKCYDPRK